MENFNDDTLQVVEQDLDNLLSGDLPVEKAFLNDIVSTISKVFMESASEVGMVKFKRKTQSNKKVKRTNKPWFDNECTLKRQFTKARRRALLNRNDAFLQSERRRLAKIYKTMH